MNINKLKKIIKERGLNQTKVAYFIHTSKSSLCNKMQGNRYFSIDDMKKIKEILHLSNDEVCDIFLD